MVRARNIVKLLRVLNYCLNQTSTWVALGLGAVACTVWLPRPGVLTGFQGLRSGATSKPLLSNQRNLYWYFVANAERFSNVACTRNTSPLWVRLISTTSICPSRDLSWYLTAAWSASGSTGLLAQAPRPKASTKLISRMAIFFMGLPPRWA